MNEVRLRNAARRAARRLGVSERDAATVLRNELAGLLAAERKAAAPEPPAGVTPGVTPGPARTQNVRFATEDETGGSYVRIPFLPKAEHAKPLKKAIGYAADKMGLSHYLVTELM